MMEYNEDTLFSDIRKLKMAISNLYHSVNDFLIKTLSLD